MSALQSASGVIPALDCSSGVLNHIRWYFNLKGSVIDGEFIPINAPTAGSCPSNGIQYVPKA
ncbi:ribonuclease T2-like [Mortierella antarctica]|nr:ribonuclease T2-like [Mortierella antarctica]